MLDYRLLPDNDCLENEKAVLPKVFELIRRLKVGLIYGPISPEDRPYYRRAVLGGPAASMSITHVASALTQRGLRAEIINPELFGFLDRLRNIDFALIMVHGPFGEDGKIQGLFEYLRIPYLGSPVLPSAICNSKTICKAMVRSLGLPTPSHTRLLPRTEEAIGEHIACSGLSFPAMLKCDTGGSSVGMVKCKSLDDVISQLSSVSPNVPYFCESFANGTSCTVSLIQLGTTMFCAEPMEIETVHEFYDEISKLEGGNSGAGVRYHYPARISKRAAQRCMENARLIAEQLQLTVYARVDFIVSEDGTPHFLEVNTLPGLSPETNFVTGMLAFGFSYADLLVLLIRASLVNTIEP
ncbi:D-alanine--D-alanine ligase family protein [Bradyrhizobium canariense]|nr:hypothetical protein [Bradyrhizobium canariense]